MATKKTTIPETEGQSYQSSKIVMINILNLTHHPENPRKNIGNIAELTESIKKNGIMQNLTVIPAIPKEKDYYCDEDVAEYEKDPNKHLYRVMIGNRRMEAAKAAGVKELPCRIVTKLSFRQQLSIMLEENMQRTDLTIREQAEGFQLMFDLGETIETIEKKTGFSETTIRHRINIAKLDKRELDKKEKEFQLSLTDLYALEKIKDVKARNKALAEATSSESLARKIDIAVREEKQQENKAVWVKMFKERGIIEEPELANDWGQNYKEVRYISLDEKPASKLVIQGVAKDEQIYWCQRYSSLKLATKIKKAKDGKKELTPEELERKESEKKKKEIRELTKLCVKEINDFVIGIVEGKFTTNDKDLVIYANAWEALKENISDAHETGFYKVLTGDNYWGLEEEERKKVKKRFDFMDPIKQMLILTADAINNIEMFDYYRLPKTESLRQMRVIASVLERYGFDWPNEKLESIANGTSDLYKTRDETDGNDDE